MSLVELLARDLAVLARPALFNLYFAALAIPLGFALAVPLALGRASARPLVAGLCRGYIFLFRGSPFFIQLFAAYAGLLALNLPLWKPLGIDGLVLHPLVLGPVLLALNSAAYTGAILHGAIASVPRGELDAARALGMSDGQRRRFVVWPHVLRTAWPAYVNEMVFTFHATALIYFTLPVIAGQEELMNMANELFARDFNVFVHFSVAALYFLALSLLIFALGDAVQRRLTRHLPAPARLSWGGRIRRAPAPASRRAVLPAP
jgi:polar amino acid transport system permease protein